MGGLAGGYVVSSMFLVTTRSFVTPTTLHHEKKKQGNLTIPRRNRRDKGRGGVQNKHEYDSNMYFTGSTIPVPSQRRRVGITQRLVP